MEMIGAVSCALRGTVGVLFTVLWEANVFGASSNVPWGIESTVLNYNGVSSIALSGYIGVFKMYRRESSLSWRTIIAWCLV